MGRLGSCRPARARLTAFGMTRRTGRSAENDPGLTAIFGGGTSVVCLVGKTWDFHVTVALGAELDENIEQTLASRPDLLIELNDALDRLALEDDQSAQVFKLRVFAGLPMKEVAEMLGMAERTAYDNWGFARAWLGACLRESGK